MDVTPPTKMFQSMASFVDAMVGEAPSPANVSTTAVNRRTQRKAAFDYLHKLVGLAMREGVRRADGEAKMRREGLKPADMQDRNAIARARDDAQAGTIITELKH